MVLIGKCVGKLTYFLVLTVVILIHPSAEKISTMKKIVRIEVFQNCQDRPQTEQYFKTHNHLANVKIERVKLEQYITADYVVTRPVKTIPGTIQVMKCETTEPSTCEFLMNMKSSVLCARLVEKGAFWTPLMDTIQPRVKCPLTKQVHRIINGSFSSIISSPFITEIPGGTDFFWAFKFSYTDPNNVEVGCIFIVIKLYHVKVKQ